MASALGARGATRERARRVALPSARLLLPALLVAPLLVVYLWDFVLPVGNMLVTSFFGYSRRQGIIHELTLDNYVRFFGDLYYWLIIARTVKLSLLATLVSLVLGYPAAYYASRASPRLRGYLLIVILAPLLVSVVARTFGWVVILGPRGLGGAIGAFFGQPELSLLYSEAAVIVGLVNVYLPFMVLSIYASLMTIDADLFRASANLGASPLETFGRVTLPLSLPGVLAGCVLVLSLSASAFITPMVLGGSQNTVLAGLVFQQNTVLMNWPLGAVMSLALLALVSSVVLLNTRLVERGKYTIVFQ